MKKLLLAAFMALLICFCTAGVLADDQVNTLAIINFSNSGSVPKLEGTATDAVTADIVKIHNFQVFDRKHLQSVMDEQKLGQTGLIDATTASKIGQLLGVKYIMVGSVSGNIAHTPGHYSTSWDSTSGSSYWVDDSYQSNVDLTVSIIETNTGKVAFSTHAKGDSPDRNVENALAYAVYDACRAVYTAFPIRGYVIKIDGNKCYLDVGQNFNITKGDRFIVTHTGEGFVNPVTGKVLSQKKNVAVLEAKEVYDEMCIAATVKDSAVKDATNVLTVGDTVTRMLRDKPSTFLIFGSSEHVY